MNFLCWLTGALKANSWQPSSWSFPFSSGLPSSRGFGRTISGGFGFFRFVTRGSSGGVTTFGADTTFVLADTTTYSADHS